MQGKEKVSHIQMETCKVNVALKWRVATTVRRHSLTQHTASIEEPNYHTSITIMVRYRGRMIRGRLEAGEQRHVGLTVAFEY